MPKALPYIVKINYCSATDLLQLEGIGQLQAEMIIKYRAKHGPFLTVEDLMLVPGLKPKIIERITDKVDWSLNGHYVPSSQIIKADARHLVGIPANSIDLIVTSPPYWECRDYGHRYQIGHESTAEKYIETLVAVINTWKSILRPHATVFINIDDVFRNKNLVGIPSMFETQVRKSGWLVVNRIMWIKDRGLPEPKSYRFSHRYEYVFQLAQNRSFFADLHGLKEHLGNSASPTDVWLIDQVPSKSDHMAPFPTELARRAILAGCPEHVCSKCGKPYQRKLRPSMNLDMTRPQAKRAMEIFKASKLTAKHFAAIRAVGISDAGKGKNQNGASLNSAQTVKLAREAKEALGGYFREFTFAPKRQVGWIKCSCRADSVPGTVLDPFMGSGTTLRVAVELGRNAIGVDLKPPKAF